MEFRFGLMAAVSQIYRMCPKKDFPSIKDRGPTKVLSVFYNIL